MPLINPTHVIILAIIGALALLIWTIEVISIFIINFGWRKKRCYIAGAVSGHDLREVDRKFRKAAEEVRRLGFVPVNPRSLVHLHRRKWLDFMRIDIRAALQCDALYALECWSGSTGAGIEVQLFKDLNLPVIYQSTNRARLREELMAK